MHQFLVYFSIALTGIASLSLAHDPEVLALVVGLLVSLLVPLWFVSTVIEINHAGLNVYRLFALVRTEISWSEVTEYKSNALGQGVKLFTRRREVVDVSAQIYGYAFILDILRQRRPDLFPLP